ncbi:hypothetical protein [Murimonas intestini]|mgnify:CR=1 FL=1|uniref:hypothetical protein n=1 Tax=Murimonas intestini TaxID=1337051 RepID=UPI00248A9961|nr:hypothetical protein [Murimonas intestini]
MEALKRIINGNGGSHILPFFWMKGEDNQTIRAELDAVCECGIREICLESRPHPDFCGPGWWENLDFIMKEARERRMRIWVLDDDKFPTGHCNGAIEKKYPHLAKTYLAERHMDICGPCRNNAVLVENFLGSDGKLLGILAVPKPDGESLAVSGEGIIDLTEKYHDGFVYFELPEGRYRLFILFTTQAGGGRPHYMNLIDSASVRVLIDEVYEKHYERYKEYFGKEFAGFFSDEPELGNVPGYPFDCALGQKDVKLPWSGELEEALRGIWKGSFLKSLPALWYESGDKTNTIRFTYMDEMTKLVYKCFSGQLGSWCESRGAEYIGHILEDANSHTKLGCGTGHYFREMRGQHMAGVDVVHHQIVPGFTEKVHQWIAGDTDGEFFHFGLAKLGSSAAHIDPSKKGRALCEIFGNYGWAAGMPLMRWLTDHMLVRGINEFTPHAFAMKYPDPDCPPHFYARGNNPQFGCFKELMKYMNRAAALLSKGVHKAQAAVLYHGEAEWADENAMLFQKPVRALMERQLDCDVVPCDVLCGEQDQGRQPAAAAGAYVQDGLLHINQESYSCLVIPGCRMITPGLAEFVINSARAGLKIYVAGEMPGRLTDGSDLPEGFTAACENTELTALADKVGAQNAAPVTVTEHNRGLRLYMTEQEDGLVCMLFNENVSEKISTVLRFADAEIDRVTYYDAWNNRSETYKLPGEGLPVSLEPGCSLLLAAGKDNDVTAGENAEEVLKEIPEEAGSRTLSVEWKVSRRKVSARGYEVSAMESGVSAREAKVSDAASGEAFEEYVTLPPAALLPNLNGPGYDIGFTGTYRYEGSFVLEKEEGVRYFLKFPEASDALCLYINDREAGWLGNFPGRVEVTELVLDGENRIRADVTTTLVWERRDGASTHLQIPASGITMQPVLEMYR